MMKLRPTEFLCLLFAFICMLSCIEYKEIDNNLNGVTFFILFFVLGLVISIYIIKKKIKRVLPDYILKSGKTFSAVQGSLLGIAILLPSLANYYNRHSSIGEAYNIKYKAVEKTDHYYRRAHSYWYRKFKRETRNK